MLAAEFGQFEIEIKRLEKIFGKSLDDETMQAYWSALKDQHLAQFKRFVAHHEKAGKFFPKPFELRPKDERPVIRDSKADGDFKTAEARCMRNLEELRRKDPDKWRAEVTVRKLDRLIATTDADSPAYPLILKEWRQARGIHVGINE